MSLFTANGNLSKELERKLRVGGDMLGSRRTDPKTACNWHIAVLIILLGTVFNLQSHAQASQMSSSCLPNYSFNDVPGSIPAADTAIMWPVVWQPGHTYSVTITGPTLTPTPGKCGEVGVFAREWPGYANPLKYGGADPYITLTNFTILDPTHMTYTASVSADAPIGNIFLQLSNPTDPNISFWAVMIDNPTPPSLPGAPDSSCPIPGDAVVKPDTWQAGQSYPIVITGSGFTTAAVAASNGCSETSIDVQVDAGTVTLSNVQVVSSTIITAQAKVSDDTPDEEATINIYGPALGPQAIPRTPLQQRSTNSQVSHAGLEGTGGLTLDGTANANIVDAQRHYYVQYRAYIPADHLVTTVPCYLGQEQASPIPDIDLAPYDLPIGLIEVLGDASSFSTQYRIKEYVNLLTSGSGPASEPSIKKASSVSYNFEVPTTRGSITSSDFNPDRLLLCYHEQNKGSSSLADVGGATNSASANEASVTFCCSGADPLFKNPVAPIRFNLTVSINSKTNEATISGKHTCFPSHEIAIGNQIVYRRNPSVVNFFELSKCLLGPAIGLEEINVNCTVKLDGVSTCH